MLKELKISNFRGFCKEVTVRFAPITVLIGRNNSGKSSIIKFLLMLQQSTNPGNSRFLTSSGERVDLGPFADLKNSRSKNHHLQFQVDVDQHSPGYYLGEYVDILAESQGDQASPAHSKVTYSVSATVPYGYDGKEKPVTAMHVINEKEQTIATFESVSDNTAFLDFSQDHESKFFVCLHSLQASAIRHRESAEKTVAKILAERDIIKILRKEINSPRHISPVREETKKVIATAPPPEGDVGQSGQYTLPHLQKMQKERVDLYDFILPHMQSVAGVTDIRFSNIAEPATQCLAKNTTTDCEVHISDFGFGVSQSLPVFVQGAIMPHDTFLMVEQPEAHLHPTAQLEMGEFFVDLWKKRNVGSIIETHSSNIVLRLQRLVAKGTLCPAHVSIAFFDIKNKVPVVENLDIAADGSLKEGLPMEFFHQDIWEAIEMDAEQ